jgi:arsenate reductase
MTITIWHNPKCGTSRNVLEMVRASGVEPTVVDYLTTGWDQATLRLLAEASGEGIKGLLRTKGTRAEALGLLDAEADEEAILEAMINEPGLVNRPIVQSMRGTRLCRPSELVLELLDTPPETFIKEDGEIVSR